MSKKTEREEEFALWRKTLTKMEATQKDYRDATAVADRAQQRLRATEILYLNAKQSWNKLSNAILDRRGLE